MLKNKKMIALMLTMVFALTVIAAPAFASAKLSGTILISGSTSVQPIADELVKEFTKKNPGVSITVTGGGSGAGIKDAAAGRVNIGNSSRDLKPTDPQGLVKNVIAWDGVIVIVNSKNTVKGLTKEQVIKIFAGEITNWKEVGAKKDAPIVVYQRAVPSGTLDFFLESFMDGKKIVDTSKHFASNSLLMAAAAKDPNAIGFTSMGSLKGVKALAIDGVAGDMKSANSGKYKYVRPFLMVTKGAPTGVTKDFIKFVQSPAGQKIVGKKYIQFNKIKSK